MILKVVILGSWFVVRLGIKPATSRKVSQCHLQKSTSQAQSHPDFHVRLTCVTPLGRVSRNPPKPFGPSKPFVKHEPLILQSFQHVFEIRKGLTCSIVSGLETSIQCELLCPTSARKVLELCRNARMDSDYLLKSNRSKSICIFCLWTFSFCAPLDHQAESACCTQTCL